MSATEVSPRGNLKVYLGYAAGVGKTFQMLSDANEAARRGADVVVAYFEPHGRPDTIAQVRNLEVIPHRNHTNIPGSHHVKRWEDVQVLLEAGIEVWTTMNVQHIESLNDQVWQITGIQVRETVPDWIVRQAAEIVAVDVTPEALLNRLKRGAVYKPEVAEKALAGFFKGSNLGALRELTLRQAAHEVDLRQFAFDESSGFRVPRVSEVRSGQTIAEPTKERILIHITADPSTAMLIRRGRRVADYLQADCLALFVHNKPSLVDLPAAEREAVEKHLRFARSLRVETHILFGTDIPQTVVDFARHNSVSQIFVARMRKQFHERLFGKDYSEAIVRGARDLQVTVVADRSRREGSRAKG